MTTILPYIAESNATQFWLNVLVALTSSAGTSLAFIFYRRKNRAETIYAELANVDKAIDIYRKLAEDLQAEIRDLKLELEKVYEQNKQVIAENKDLKRKLQELESKLDNFK